jgi:ParB-like chromosome segregation protein Spo0J
MAKRRRLNPAPTATAVPIAVPAGLETKSLDVSHAKQVGAVAPPPPAPPIARVAGEAAERAALQEMSDFLARARAEGQLTIRVPLDRIRIDHLTRDRLLPPDPAADEDMAALMASLRARGQQVPIDVVRRHDSALDTYGLISGLRRMTALRLLHEETGERRFAEVSARVIAPETLPEAYLAMVEENEIRAGLSFYERARIAREAVAAGAFEDLRAALRGLFGAVSRAKRSKIGSFAAVVEALDGHLAVPAALPERRGLALAQALQEGRVTAEDLRAALAGAAGAEAEQAALEAALRGVAAKGDGPDPAPKARAASRAAPGEALRLEARPGRIVLTGAGADEALAEELRAWLAARDLPVG